MSVLVMSSESPTVLLQVCTLVRQQLQSLPLDLFNCNECIFYCKWTELRVAIKWKYIRRATLDGISTSRRISQPYSLQSLDLGLQTVHQILDGSLMNCFGSNGSQGTQQACVKWGSQQPKLESRTCSSPVSCVFSCCAIYSCLSIRNAML